LSSSHNEWRCHFLEKVTTFISIFYYFPHHPKKSQKGSEINSNRAIALSSLLLATRQSLLRNLHSGSSLIELDLLILVFSNYALQREPMSVKALLAALPYSPMASRYHLREAEKRDLLRLSRDPQDKRILRVVPSTKLMECFERIDADLSPHIKPHLLSLRL
jgi:DNA-binding MarR family transcriptional regulator